MADQEIKTSIDALVAYLNDHGETNVETIARALSVSESMILDWANVLEKANFIRIAYRSGRAYLSPITGGAAGVVVTKEARQVEQSRMEAEISSQMAIVNHIAVKIDNFSKDMSKIDDIFRTKYKNVKDMLDKVNKIDTYVESVEKRMESRTSHIKDVAEKAQKDFETAQKYLTSLSGFSVDTNNAKAVSQELHGQLKAYEKNMLDLSKGLESVIYQYRKNAVEIAKNIRDRRGELSEILNFEDKQIRDYERAAQEYSRRSEAAVRQNKVASKQIFDDLSKATSEVSKLSVSMSSEINSVKSRVDDMKKDLGQMAELNDGLVKIRKDLEAVSKQRDALLADLKKMQDDAKLIAAKGAASGVTKAGMEKKSMDVEGSVADINSKVDKINKDFESLGKGDKDGGA